MALPRPLDFNIVSLKQGDPLREIWESAQQNADFYERHADDLWRLHDGMELLIYSDGIVEGFADISGLVDRLDSLDDHTRASAIHRWQRAQGTWLL